MEIKRTPDEAFQDLPGYDFDPNYVEISDFEGSFLRMHYVDEGPGDARPVIMLHGEPTWSYLYRKMIPIIAGAGYRAIAPDLVGFGRSDKPADRKYYTYQRHVDWMKAMIAEAGLKGMTIVGQDWGGLIGLRLVAEHPDLFHSVVIGNTGLPTGDHKLPSAFMDWQKLAREMPEFDVGAVIRYSAVRPIAEDVVAAYEAPYPDESYKEGARIFPSLVPTGPDDPSASANRLAWEALERFEKPFLTAFSDKDETNRNGERFFINRVPGAQGQPHTIIKNAGHFLQEDAGEEFANVIVSFLEKI